MFYVDVTCVIFPFIVLILSYQSLNCNAITNTSLNVSDRYKVIDDSNVTHVKTLQKEDKGKITYFTPVNNPVKFKEIPDSALSTSDSHSRGLPFHEHQGYGLNDYEESPHYGYDHDYHFQDPHLSHHNPHTYEHHDYEHHHYPGYHNYGHGHGYGHYKYDKHALATKALWPLAGIALLGAAALAVSSPILVQLGVVSGKRRRRATAEINEPDFAEYSLKKYTENIAGQNTEIKVNNGNSKDNLKRKSAKADTSFVEQSHNDKFKRKFVTNYSRLTRSKIMGYQSTIKSHNIDQSTKSPWKYDKTYEDDRFIPIPIKLRSPKGHKPYD